MTYEIQIEYLHVQHYILIVEMPVIRFLQIDYKHYIFMIILSKSFF